ncbi:MAG: hypothetical protein HYW86_05560, partial [Candidatus Roizmanbacteria bacterium]
MYNGASYNAAAGVFAARESASAASLVFYSGSNMATERMRIDSAGNVGIGTTSPFGMLQVGATSTPYTPNFFVSAAANGNVGIGTTGPAAKFEVIGNANFYNGTTPVLQTIGNSVQITDGNANSPALTFNGDTNTGIYRAAADMLALITGGLERLRINDNGNVGIGGVVGTGPYPTFSINGLFQVGNSNTPPLFVTSATGNVGIGTTAPGFTLDVLGNGVINPMRVASAGGSSIAIQSTDDNYAQLSLNNSGNSALAQIRYTFSDNSFALNNRNTGPFIFKVDDVEKIRFTANGNVGIGTTNPFGMLQVGATNSPYVPALFVSTGGNIGIGTTNPTRQLTIGGSGQIKFSGDSDHYIYDEDENPRIYIKNNVNFSGTDAFTVGSAQITNALPTQFTSSGDVSIAYDLNFTNPTASYIKSQAPFYIQSGESFASSDLTLATYNSGDLMMDIGGTGTGTGTIKFYDSNVKGATTTTPIAFSDSSSDINTYRTNYTDETIIGALNEVYAAALGSSGFWLDGGDYLYPNSTYATNIVATTGRIGVGTTNPFGMLQVGATNSPYVQASNTVGIFLDSEATNADALVIQAKYAANFTQDLSGGYGLSVSRNLNEAGSYPLVSLVDDHTANTQTTLKIQQDGTGDILNLFDGATEVFTVLDGGNVGIGITGPAAGLEIARVNSTGGSLNALTLSGTLGVMDGSDTFRGLYVNTNSNTGHTNTNTIYGVDINNSGTTSVYDNTTEGAIHVAGNWDYMMKLENTDNVTIQAPVRGSIAMNFMFPAAYRYGRINMSEAPADTTGLGFHANFDFDQAGISVDSSVGTQFILTSSNEPSSNDFDHAAQTNPTLFIQDATDPDITNNKWGSLNHDGTGFVITSGDNTGAGTSPATIDNYIAFAPRGTERVRIDGTGNVGIGTTNPFGMLQVGATNSSLPSFFVGVGATAYVGIGTTAPANALHVKAYDNVKGMRLESTNATVLEFYTAATGNNRNWMLATNYNIAGDLSFVRGTTNSDAPSTTAMIIDRNGNVGIGTANPLGSLHVGSTSFFVATNGNVGIGTTGPVRKLDVTSGGVRTDLASGLTLSNTFSSGNNVTYLYDNGGAGTFTIATTIHSDSNGNSMPITFRLSNPTDGRFEAMRISNTGNVGIGTTDPSSFKLEIAGDVGPSADNTYDLGSTAKSWQDLYLTGNLCFDDTDCINGSSVGGGWQDLGTAVALITQTDNVYPSAASNPSLSVNSNNFNNPRVGIGANGASIVGHEGAIFVLAGIGTAAGTQNNAIEMQVDGTDLDAGTSLEFLGGSNRVARINGMLDGAINSGYLTFSTNNAGAGLTERMRISKEGNVGIGTTSPFGMLQVGATSTPYTPNFFVSASANGNVGIGTTNPMAGLQISKANADYKGQLVLVDPDNNGDTNAAITAISGYGKDLANGNSTGRMWYLGSTGGSDKKIYLYNHLADDLLLGT